ncbi:nickel/cobalt transporter [Prosthecodimorpha staleyi]|uniref:Nickel/cobalt efflux system n=1 Tax=Prosthecodimorpha staleyi TaxID=2840188 RepID=A0A947GFN6_9HYPH|nr:nickel/cobalt transporter [Prosthecodimorpha staleyi]MBT9293016.1 nickel/cobalt transporter [Prosthecodimorpha staleyi]
MTRSRRVLLLLLLAAIGLAAASGQADAAGPFGVAAPEAGGSGGSGIFGWIAQQQSAFYRALTGAVRALKTDPTAVAGLVGLSFAYGVFHAAGPGHGKAVIASYVVANGETLKRGILLAFVSALFQALTAILFVAAAVFVLNLTSMAMTEATRGLELVSGGLITALGLWLIWTKALRRGRVFAPLGQPAMAGGPGALSAPGGFGHAHTPTCGHGPAFRLARSGEAVARPAAFAPVVACEDCGHLHAPDPRGLTGPLSLRRALSAVVSVGIRPCTGALIVLVFAFSQKLWWAGVLASLAMAVGTGVTVAVLASLAVSAKSFAVGLAGIDSPWSARIVRGAEIIGALAILTMGLLILGATLVGGASMAG